MAGSLTALVFPYTGIPAQAGEVLFREFAKTILLLPLGMEPAPGLEPALSTGRAEVIRAGLDLPEAGEIKPLLAEALGWVSSIRDIREIAHLKAALGQDSAERSPSALVTAIRRQGREKQDDGILQHLLLHLAAWHDLRESESESAVRSLEAREQALRESLAGGLERDEEDQEVFASLDPLSSGRIQDDPLLGVRLEAWAALFRETRPKADLWVTSPAAVRFLAEFQEEKSGQPPLSLMGLEPEDRESRLARAGLEGLLGPEKGLSDILEFDPAVMGKLLGMESSDQVLQGLVGVTDW